MIVRNIKDLGSPLAKAVVTIGNFDGVHIGHRKVLNLVVQRAGEVGGTSVALTFSPHPREFFDTEFHEQMITTMEQRLELIESLGVDYLIIQEFDKELASMPPKRFVSDILVGKLGAIEVCVSGKFRFGNKASGDVKLLNELAVEHGYKVISVENAQFRHSVVSSSFIRGVLLKGEMDIAMKMLGRPYCIVGTVYPDTKRGTRILKFPTSNVRPENELIPPTGIYASSVVHADVRLPAATYIGSRPTFGGGKRVIETHIIGFSGSLYDSKISVEFYRKIREDIKFETPEALQAQIAADVEDIIAFLGRHRVDPEFPVMKWKGEH